MDGDVQSVAVLALWDEGRYPRAEGLERLDQHRGRSDAVGVEVAVDDDRLLVGDRPGDPVDCFRHALEQVGVVDRAARAVEEGADLSGTDDAAVQEKLHDQGVNARKADEVGGVGGGPDDPAVGRFAQAPPPRESLACTPIRTRSPPSTPRLLGKVQSSTRSNGDLIC